MKAFLMLTCLSFVLAATSYARVGVVDPDQDGRVGVVDPDQDGRVGVVDPDQDGRVFWFNF